MQTVKSESLILIAIAMLGVGFAFEHGAVEHGGGLLWGLLGLILAAIIGVAFRIAHHAEVLALISASPEILTALKAAHNDRMQTTVNIALGASLATVLLTLPVIEAIALFAAFVALVMLGLA